MKTAFPTRGNPLRGLQVNENRYIFANIARVNTFENAYVNFNRKNNWLEK
jgi:hypothetical protein